MSKPRTIKFLDLCCKAGGCSMGYFQAANELGIKIEITGIDIEPQPNYPFRFLQRDAVEYLNKYGHMYTHIHASPPCQKYSASTKPMMNKGKEYKDCLAAIIAGIEAVGKPSIIENVMPAPLRGDIILSGHMFGLQVLKKRKFDLYHWFCMQPGIPRYRGSIKGGDYAQCIGNGQLKVTGGKRFKIDGNSIKEVWGKAMGISWMEVHEMAEAIPPAFTKYIGLQLFAPMASTRKKRVAPAKQVI